MTNEQFWLEVAKLVVTTGATGVAAWFAIQIASSQRDIARRQWATANEAREIAAAKLKFDLFAKRLPIFNVAWTALSTNALLREYTWEDSAEFRNLIPEARFLFGPEIETYMKEISDKLVELRSAVATQVNEGTNAENQKAVNEAQGWFFKEAKNCREKFGKYLDFGEWR